MSDTVTPLEQLRLLLRNFGIVRDAVHSLAHQRSRRKVAVSGPT